MRMNEHTFFLCILRTLIPILHQKAKRGTPHQAKQAVHCIHAIFNNKEVQLAQIFEVSHICCLYLMIPTKCVLLRLTCTVHISCCCCFFFFYIYICIYICIYSLFVSALSLCPVVWMQTSQSSSSLPSCLWATLPCLPQTSLRHRWSPSWQTSS